MKKLALTFLFIYSVQILYAQLGASLNLNGESDYILVEDHNSLDLNTSFTVEAWVNMNEIEEGLSVIFRKGWCATDDNSYYLGVVDGRVRWFWDIHGVCSPTINYYETVSEVIHENQCFHISVVHNSSSIKIYVDNTLMEGTLIDGEYGTVHSSSEPLSIGAYRNSVGGGYHNFFNGRIDEIRFWNYELSQEEIEEYSVSNLSGSEEGLIVYYDMEDTGYGDSLILTNKSSIESIPNGIAMGHSESTPNFEEGCINNNLDIEKLSDKAVKVYPNPSNDYITVSFGEEPIYYLTITDLFGKEVFRREKISSSSLTLDIGKINPGIYMLSVFNNSDLEEGYTTKLVIE